MAGFTGTFEMKVDGKGRVSLPADFRDSLPESQKRAVWLFPSPNGDALEGVDADYVEKLNRAMSEQFDAFSEEENEIAALLEEMRKSAIDDTGRIVLPSDFAEDAGIADKAVFVGRGPRFQIRSPEVHARIKAERKGKRPLAGLRVPVGGGE